MAAAVAESVYCGHPMCHKPFSGMADVIGVYCLVWVYTHKFTQTLQCCSIVSPMRYGGLDRSVLFGLGVYTQVYPNLIVL